MSITNSHVRIKKLVSKTINVNILKKRWENKNYIHLHITFTHVNVYVFMFSFMYLSILTGWIIKNVPTLTCLKHYTSTPLVMQSLLSRIKPSKLAKKNVIFSRFFFFFSSSFYLHNKMWVKGEVHSTGLPFQKLKQYLANQSLINKRRDEKILHVLPVSKVIVASFCIVIPWMLWLLVFNYSLDNISYRCVLERQREKMW